MRAGLVAVVRPFWRGRRSCSKGRRWRTSLRPLCGALRWAGLRMMPRVCRRAAQRRALQETQTSTGTDSWLWQPQPMCRPGGPAWWGARTRGRPGNTRPGCSDCRGRGRVPWRAGRPVLVLCVGSTGARASSGASLGRPGGRGRGGRQQRCWRGRWWDRRQRGPCVLLRIAGRRPPPLARGGPGGRRQVSGMRARLWWAMATVRRQGLEDSEYKHEHLYVEFVV